MISFYELDTSHPDHPAYDRLRRAEGLKLSIGCRSFTERLSSQKSTGRGKLDSGISDKATAISLAVYIDMIGWQTRMVTVISCFVGRLDMPRK